VAIEHRDEVSHESVKSWCGLNENEIFRANYFIVPFSSYRL